MVEAMGLFDDVFGGDEEDNTGGSSSGDSGGIIDDVVDEVSDTVDDAVDAGQEAAGDISEGAGDVVDEVSEGDLGGAVDEAADTVEDVASGSSDTGSTSGSSGGSTSTSPSAGSTDDSGGIDFFGGDEDDGGDGGADPSPEPDSDPSPDPSNADPVDSEGQQGSGSSSVEADSLTDRFFQEDDQGLPETEEEVQQVQDRREDNFILQNATPGISEALDARKQNIQARNTLDRQINQLQDAPESADVTFGEGEESETVSVDKAVDRLEDRRSTVDRSMEENEAVLQNRGGSSSEGSGDQITDIQTFLNPLEGNPDQTVSEEALTAGIDLMQEGQEFGDQVGDLVPRPGEGKDAAIDIVEDITEKFNIGSEEDREEALNVFEEVFPEAPSFTSGGQKGLATLTVVGEQAGENLGDESFEQEDAQEFFFEVAEQQFESGTEEQLDAREDVVSGVATGGTQVTGLTLSAAGGSARALREDTPGLAEGAAAGPGIVLDEVSEDPGEFIAEEFGEELGEKIVFGTLTGGAGLAASSVPTPDFTAEVEPEFNPEVDPDAVSTVDPEPETEVEQGRTPGDPMDVEMQDLPSGFTQEQAPEVEIEPVQENEVTEAGGLEIVREGEGQTVFPDQPRAEEFDFEVGEGSTEARATPTEPDRVGDPGEFRGEDPRTQFTDVEQEVVRELRGREDVTIRQGETVEERGPGLNEPDADQTVIEVEETETGGEMVFSVIGPVPQSLVDPEPETEINPQPDIQGPEPDLADTSPDADLADVGPEVEPEPETEVTFEPEPEPETEVEPEVDTDLDPRVDPAIDQGLDDRFIEEEGQEFQQEQAPEIEERRPQEQTDPEPEGEREPLPNKIMEPEPEPTFFDEPKIEPGPEFSPEDSRDFGDEEEAVSKNPFEEESVNPEAENEFNPSLGAVIFDIEAENPGDQEVFTGTEVRPVPEDLEEEFDFPF
jgi:pilus assembly protein FimV